MLFYGPLADVIIEFCNTTDFMENLFWSGSTLVIGSKIFHMVLSWHVPNYVARNCITAIRLFPWNSFADEKSSVIAVTSRESHGVWNHRQLDC